MVKIVRNCFNLSHTVILRILLKMTHFLSVDECGEATCKNIVGGTSLNHISAVLMMTWQDCSSFRFQSMKEDELTRNCMKLVTVLRHIFN